MHTQVRDMHMFMSSFLVSSLRTFLNFLSIFCLVILTRYKIYIEGSAWSVSEKYILACDSVALIVQPLYYDFFSRSLMPTEHYWPIKANDKCRSIKFAVEWGDSHAQKVNCSTASHFSFWNLIICYRLLNNCYSTIIENKSVSLI